MVQCALAAAKKKGSYLQAEFHRITEPGAPNKAIMAVVASIRHLRHVTEGTMYRDLGPNHFGATPPTSGKRAWSSACQSSVTPWIR